MNNLLKSKTSGGEEVELLSENVKYKEKVFASKGEVLFQGLKVEQLASNSPHNNLQLTQLDPHVCQFPNDYYYNQNPLENKIMLKDQDMKQIKNT